MAQAANLDGKVALVTGAASGIGCAVARALADSGARLFSVDIAPEVPEAVAKLDGRYFECDLSRRDDVRELGRRIVEQEGGVDILVNNAGFQHVSPVEEFDDDLWATMIQVMLVAPFQLIKAFLPRMIERGWGRIVNVSSLHGVVASPFKSAYVAAKHGLMGLTKTVALEVGSHGITVNAVCPAYVRTPLVEKQILDQAAHHGISEAEVIDRIMLEPAAIKRLIEPSEIADFVLYLCSERGSSMTGAAHMMDLGWTAK